MHIAQLSIDLAEPCKLTKKVQMNGSHLWCAQVASEERDQMIQQGSTELFRALDVDNDDHVSPSELIDVCLKFDKRAPVNLIAATFDQAYARSQEGSQSQHMGGLEYKQFFALFCTTLDKVETGTSDFSTVTLTLSVMRRLSVGL